MKLLHQFALLALIGVALAAPTTLNNPLRRVFSALVKPKRLAFHAVVRQDITTCTVDSDCSSPCECLDVEGNQVCADLTLFVEDLQSCSECSGSDDCPASETCEDASDVGLTTLCSGCAQEAVIAALEACSAASGNTGGSTGTEDEGDAGDGGSSTEDEDEGGDAGAGGSSADDDDEDDTKDKDSSSSSGGSSGTSGTSGSSGGSSGDSAPAGPSGSNDGNNDGVCLETEWLRKNGHAQGILQQRGLAKVLCIPGLPCGTPGHVLKSCVASGRCMLETFAEVCDKRGDCEAKVTEVSRVRHAYDWSQVGVCEDEGGVSLSVTSLSVEESAGRMSWSWGVANVSDWLNRAGLGHVCDGIAVAVMKYGCGRETARGAMSYGLGLVSSRS